jgi:hypothetical protein
MDRDSLFEWVPGLDDTETLEDAYARMPGDGASSVPRYVRVLENPASPLALPGAIDLFGHDCIHIVLGRGALPADEAFVLGVTMGTSGNLARWQERLFAFAVSNVYRGPWRLGPSDLLLFHMAVQFAAHQGIKPLAKVPWRSMGKRSLADIRPSLGIRTAELRKFYETEQAMWPTSVAARRLPKPSPAVVADNISRNE